MKIEKWCDSCLGCEQSEKKHFRKKTHHCHQYVPKQTNNLNFIDNIIRDWFEKRGRVYD